METYEVLDLEIVTFDVEDVIITSPQYGDEVDT